MTSRLELVTFDLDNTLWDVDSVIREAERVMREWLAERAPGIVSLTTDHYAELRAGVVREHPGLAHDVTRLRAEVLLRALVKVGEHRSNAGRLAQQALNRTLCKVYNKVYTSRMSERAKVFKNGGSQAVRLPVDCRFPAGQREVSVKRIGRKVVLEPLDEWPRSFVDCLGAWKRPIDRPLDEDVSSHRDPFYS